MVSIQLPLNWEISFSRELRSYCQSVVSCTGKKLILKKKNKQEKHKRSMNNKYNDDEKQ
jgi:hypothetical protein